MKSLIGSLIGLVLSVSVGAEPLLEGQVRLPSGQPAADVQVRLFDLTDLRRFVVTTTDETGYFALPLRAFSTDRGTALPTDFALGQNYPNPFNPSTIIPYQIPASAHVRLEVFNMLGQHLATLVDGERSAGVHTAQWNGTDAAGRAVGAGVYIYRLSGGGLTVSQRMVLVDGQAGVPRAGVVPEPVLAVEEPITADLPDYGLTVTGEGLVAYVDPAFRVGVDVSSVVVERHDGIPRMKRAASGILGDVNNDGQVNVSDVLYVMLYIEDPSITLPNNGDISLGDVNGDGIVDFADAVLLARYSSNPSDPTLPTGVGPVSTDDHGNTLAEATKVSLGSSISGSLSVDDTDYFTIEVPTSGVLLVYTTGGTDTYGSILDESNAALVDDNDDGLGTNFRVSTFVSAGTYYIRVRGHNLDTGAYALYVASPLDLVVESPSIGDTTLAFGQSFTLQTTVQNQGASEADATRLTYYRSTDATISISDTPFGSDTVGNLNALATSTESISSTAPENAGTYYYGACVESVPGETNTDNNCSTGLRVTVSSAAVDPTPPLLQMYWTDWSTDTIQRADLDGSNVETLISGVNSSSLALDAAEGKMYYATRGKIQRADLDGSNVETLVSGVNSSSLALDVTESKIYWTERSEHRILRANLDGSNVETLAGGHGQSRAVLRVSAPYGLALDTAWSKMYWTDMGTDTIQRADLDGSNVETLISGVNSSSLALDAAEGKMYYATRGKIQRADLDGSNVETLVTGVTTFGLALNVAEGKIYWTYRHRGKIQRADLDGSNVETLVAGLDTPDGITLGP